MQVYGARDCVHADEECGSVWTVVGCQCCGSVGSLVNDEDGIGRQIRREECWILLPEAINPTQSRSCANSQRKENRQRART
jgi:hypothetical protein